MLNFKFTSSCFLALTLASTAPAADIGAAKPKSTGLIPEKRGATPEIAGPSNEGEAAIRGFRKPAGLKIDLWAAEPMFANPVAFCIDEQGRVFVSETYRYRTSVLDIRHYMFMLEDDMACRTVEDRIAMCKKYFGAQFSDLERETEVVRMLEDRTGSGVANFTSVYADGFNTALDGIASGVLARKGKVWFTNIPELWQMDGIDANGKAKSRKSLSHGYGVRFSFTGHDMHGLAIGPDGKLYFSFGDRGANVKTKEGKTLAEPDNGAVFRCNLDGTDMELVYTGLRNPQELVFDKYGNLFTGDNDFDHGDEERLLYIVEGGDSGWRVGFQHAPLGFDLVPWKSEDVWLNHHSRQGDYNHENVRTRYPDIGVRSAAYLPPISNIGDGPSGFVYNPGVVGLPAKYDDHFFLCHFKGSKARSKIQSFTIKPSGASFVLGESEPFLEETQPTDVDFGPDGALYFSDWGEGWERTKKGRIYRVYDPARIADPAVVETKKLINAGMDNRPAPELITLLAHADRRVRQEAQFELAERGAKSIDALSTTAARNANQLARLHAIWGLGQIGRKDAKAYTTVIPLLADTDAEVRAQAAKVLGDGRVAKAFDGLMTALKDSSARVRMFAALGVGKLGRKESVPAVLELLRANNNQDAFVRHGAVMALTGANDVRALTAAAKDTSAAVRLGVLLALRKLERPEISVFLKDADPAIVSEAARAINDVPIQAAMSDLASQLRHDAVPAVARKEENESRQEMFLLRAINANYRVGSAQNATALATYIGAKDSPAGLQAEAVHALGDWAQPPQRDRIVGVYRPLAPRKPDAAVAALKPLAPALLKGSPTAVQLATVEAVENLAIKEAGAPLFDLLGNKQADPKVRVASLKALATLNDARLSEAIAIATADSNATLRKEGNTVQAAFRPEAAIDSLVTALKNATTIEKQGALVSLSKLAAPKVNEILSAELDKLNAGTLPKELQLDLLEAAARRSNATINAKVATFEAARKKDSLGNFREALYGGNAEAGKKIFYERAEAQCVRCHRAGGEGGDVGPALAGLATRQPREYLLESVVAPNASISPGFDSYTISLNNGVSYAGILKSETDAELVLNSPEDGLMKIKKSDVKNKVKGLSGMPDGMGQILTKQELRDLVEFLASLK
jgi:quinoprotein glucose dehydrogenase